MTSRRQVRRTKRAVNLSVDATLLDAARRSGLNLSAVMERALAEETARRWLESNRQAIEAFNADVRGHGVWSDGWRRW
jgi:antitoxin CcdA